MLNLYTTGLAAKLSDTHNMILCAIATAHTRTISGRHIRCNYLNDMRIRAPKHGLGTHAIGFFYHAYNQDT